MRNKHRGVAAEAGRKPANPLVSLRPEVDYPQQGERFCGPGYTIRVGAPAAAGAVEVSIDQGAWQACRPAEGYWWYDWSGYDAGEHEVLARAIGADGAAQSSEPHEFWVEP